MQQSLGRADGTDGWKRGESAQSPGELMRKRQNLPLVYQFSGLFCIPFFGFLYSIVIVIEMIEWWFIPGLWNVKKYDHSARYWVHPESLIHFQSPTSRLGDEDPQPGFDDHRNWPTSWTVFIMASGCTQNLQNLFHRVLLVIWDISPLDEMGKITENLLFLWFLWFLEIFLYFFFCLKWFLCFLEKCFFFP